MAAWLTLKVDVEGWEWEVLDSWLSTWDVLPFTQLQVVPNLTESSCSSVLPASDLRPGLEQLT